MQRRSTAFLDRHPVLAGLDTKLESHIKCGTCHDCKGSVAVAPFTTEGSMTVYAIEPQPKNVQLLTDYATHLGSHLNAALRVYAFAMADFAGVGTFTTAHAGDEASALEAASGASNKYEVRVQTVDAFMNRVVDPTATFVLDMLLIDTEGHDPAVLAGAASTLPFTRLVVFEYHDKGMWAHATSLRAEVARLDGLGFDCYLEWDPGAWRLTGCWNPVYEFRRWSNVLCANRRDKVWAACIAAFAL